MAQRQSRLAPHWSATPIARILRPMQKFIHQEQSSGLILLAMTILALLIANSPLSEAYFRLLEAKLSVTAGAFVLEETVLHWINDGLMAIFFFLVGLEIKREMLVGELASPRAAALPIIAAVGGVLVPAAIYLLLNAGGIGARRWARGHFQMRGNGGDLAVGNVGVAIGQDHRAHSFSSSCPGLSRASTSCCSFRG